MKNARARACDINLKVRAIVKERDGYCCALCGGNGLFMSIAHYIPRSKGGLGIEQNLLVLCQRCHHNYDNTTKRQEYAVIIRDYLNGHYPGFDHDRRFYKKESI